MDVDHSLNLTSLTVDNCLTVFKIFLANFFAIHLHYFSPYRLLTKIVQYGVKFLLFMLIGESFITAK